MIESRVDASLRCHDIRQQYQRLCELGLSSDLGDQLHATVLSLELSLALQDLCHRYIEAVAQTEPGHD